MLLQADLSMLGADLAAIVKSTYQPRLDRLEKLLLDANEEVLATRELLADAIDRISHLEARAPIPGPIGETGPPGPPGPPGERGEPGPPGERGLDGAAGPAGERGEPGPTGAAGAPGMNGEPGLPGEKGTQGDCGPAGEQGIAGRDGRDGQPGRDGANGLDGAPGPAGKDGADGRDGLGFDDFSVLFDGERTITLHYERGDVVKDFPIIIATVLDRGVWRDGEFKRGDGVTWDGSFWIAQKDTTEKPGVSSEWRLAVKRGRDGKAGRDGKDGAIGPKGDRGEQGPRGFGG